MNKSRCPWCNHVYLITDKDLATPDIKNFYQDHLDNGCNPSMSAMLLYIVNASYLVQKEFVA